MLYGSESATVNPRLYHEAVADLVETYKLQIEWRYSQLTPLVVNFFDVNKGSVSTVIGIYSKHSSNILGTDTDFEFLKETVEVIQPTVVFLVNRGRMEEAHCRRACQNMSGKIHEESDLQIVDSVKRSAPHAAIKRISYRRRNTTCKCLSAPNIRKMSLINHLTQSYPDTTVALKILNEEAAAGVSSFWNTNPSFCSRQPRIVPFAHVQIKFMDLQIAPSLVSRALNGTIVFLSTEAAISPFPEQFESTLRVAPMSLSASHKVTLEKVLGLGLIRGMDAKSSLIYIITPPYIPQADLTSVRTLIRSPHIETPLYILAFGRTKASAFPPPYTTRPVPKTVKGAAVNKRFNLLRKRHKLT